MKSTLSIKSQRKLIFFIILSLYCIIFYATVATTEQELYPVFYWIPCLYIPLIFSQYIISVKSTATEFYIFKGVRLLGIPLGFTKKVEMKRLDCIHIFRIGGRSKGFGKAKSGFKISNNVLQLLSFTESVLLQIDPFDDKESYKIALWLQTRLKVEIHDLMGRDIEILPYEG